MGERERERERERELDGRMEGRDGGREARTDDRIGWMGETYMDGWASGLAGWLGGLRCGGLRR